MSDVSGIPNMGFGGGSYFGTLGGIPNVAPAMSSAQINASMGWNPNAAQFNPFANSGGGFGVQPAHYAGLGAAFGRATGGFGRMPDGSAAPAGRVGTIGNPGTSNPGYNPGGRGGGVMDWLGLGSGLGANPGGVERGFDLPDLSPAQNPFISPQVRAPVTSEPRSPFTGLGFGGNRDFLASILRQSASPQGPDLRLGFGKADRSPLFTGGGDAGAGPRGITDFGGQSRTSSSFLDRWGEMASPARSGGIGSDMLRGGQNRDYAQPWHSLIPTNRGLNTPEIIKQIEYTAGRGRYDPAALAGVIDTESKWNPRTNTGSYFGATQMGADTFKDFGSLGGMNFGQYKQAPLERQIPAYGDWLANYAKAPNSAGRLATSDIRGQSVPMQAAILQGTQFSPYGGLPNTPQWPQAFARGDTTSVSPSPIDPRTGLPARQADFLSPGGRGSIPPTLSSMNDYYARLFGGLR